MSVSIKKGTYYNVVNSAHCIFFILVMSRVYVKVRGHHSIYRGGGVRGFFADKLFISTRLGGALDFFFFNITCLHGTVCSSALKVNYLFHTESARDIQKKYSSLPLLLSQNGF